MRLKGNLPTVRVDEITIHPRDNAMIVGTLLSVWAVRETRHHVTHEVASHATAPRHPLPRQAEIFRRTSLTARHMRRRLMSRRSATRATNCPRTLEERR